MLLKINYIFSKIKL